MNNEFVCQFSAFKGEATLAQKDVLVEVVEVTGSDVEIGFTAPLPGKPRLYITISLPELIAQSMKTD